MSGLLGIERLINLIGFNLYAPIYQIPSKEMVRLMNSILGYLFRIPTTVRDAADPMYNSRPWFYFPECAELISVFMAVLLSPHFTHGFSNFLPYL